MDTITIIFRWAISIMFALMGIIGGPWIIGLGINEFIQRIKGCDLYSYIIGITFIIGGFCVIIAAACCVILCNPVLYAIFQ